MLLISSSENFVDIVKKGITKMSFEWKCSVCKKKIVVPYKSSKTMSSYACAYCSNCFKSKIDVCEETGEFYKAEDEDGILINHYRDIEGIIFECNNI